MKEFESDIFGVIPQPDTFDEIVDLIRRPHLNEARVVRMWRGQADIAWRIDSAAYRRLAQDKAPTDKALISYEEDLLRRATHRGFRHVDGRTLSDFDLLARLQHHGAATRLVDATRNALVALYFSVNSCLEKTGVLIGLHADFLGGYEEEPQDDDYGDVIKDLTKFSHPQTWQPPAVSPRIAAQHSQLLYSAVSTQKTGSLFISEKPGALLAIAISPEMKKSLLLILSEVFDIRHITLFPDIDGFGKANAHEVGRWDSYRW
jgi:hypothetical protein